MTKFTHLNTSTPDHFLGFGGITVAVPVDALTTRDSLRASILEDINATIWEEFPFKNDAELNAALDELLKDTATYPFPTVGDDLPMPEGYFAESDKQGKWTLYEGSEDDIENAEVVEEGLPSYAGALVEANQVTHQMTGEVYAYFGILHDDNA